MTRRYKAILAAGIMLTATQALAEPVKISGTVTDIFGHRYVIAGPTSKALVDLGRRGAEAVPLKSGDVVVIDGDLTPAGEVRAFRVAVGDAAAVDLPRRRSWWKRMTSSEPDAGKTMTIDDAKAMVSKAGYEVVGIPRPVKRHFEVLGRKDGKLYEVHAHRDGELRGITIANGDDPKWTVTR